MRSQKVILITGCSSGFGFESTIALARAGHAVFAGVRNIRSDGAIKLYRRAKQEKLPIILVTIDVDSNKSVASGISRVIKKASRIDVLINNAGFGTRGPVEDFSIEEVKEQFNTNVYGTLRMIKAVTPIMRKHRSGLIINFSSISGLVSFPLFSIYSASKFAIETLTEGLWFELSHFGIHVCMLEPGSFKTGFSKNRKDARSMYRKNSPYKKLLANFDRRYAVTHSKTVGIVSKQKGTEEVVRKIVEIVNSDAPKLRYRVGMDAHKNYWIRKLLPDWVWLRLLRKIYKW
ncbi:hypothetical protein A2799_02670 [Candidatus Roizmanbacteria bacterium RIFCSPHIGHO2_01_FULL_39_24]|uniref:Short-chain dehydrogenase/reductase n=1 Tax=Candidatus Roizmanbacteria bacterium RIFCSPHIGHO2_01_FULL_39_24 TaxID=1802032 RepID=A0A1F7GKH2_9BACT|nr:MAG: hypothetical protein A2799_02670 [Candidatus Roizmanbacteria bacterium RIFCSPHIGHO2_01_FULL_39_24]OGK49660.1 MAG: hypothetical protein A3A56_02630 [Candidatus Roizmanbacteria bacterium RIFCSPLOWO2_01_FULL_40_32]